MLSGFEELEDGYRVSPSADEVFQEHFQELLSISEKWKGSAFFLGQEEVSKEEFLKALESEVEEEPEPVAEAEPEPMAEAEPEVEPETEPEAEPEPEPAKPEPEADSKPEPEQPAEPTKPPLPDPPQADKKPEEDKQKTGRCCFCALLPGVGTLLAALSGLLGFF